MKRFSCLLLFCGMLLSCFAQNSHICKYGFEFEISNQRSWGYGKPVVLSVTPNSSAAESGVRVNDIIEAMNGQSTFGIPIEDLFSHLDYSNKQAVTLTLNNLKEGKRNVVVTNTCQMANVISERDLAEAYAFYSLEDVQSRKFSCPFKINANPNVDLLAYRTFAFAKSNSNDQALDGKINGEIRTALTQIGLTYKESNPDLLIYTNYTYTPNPNYRGASSENLPQETRYNMTTKQWVTLPIYYNPLVHSHNAEYFLKLGIQLLDTKKSTPTQPVMVWEIEATEMLKSRYSLESYAEIHIPLMFMTYPFSRYKDEVTYHYNKVSYNYTGIEYNMDNLQEILNVVPGSPAAEAGLRVEDIVDMINGIKLEKKSQKSADKYKQFIYKTMPLRNPKTLFTNAEGFTRCMYWDQLKNVQISETFKKEEYATAYSYLFYYRPYVNLSETNLVTFYIRRLGNERLSYRVKPVIKTEESFEVR